MSERFIATIDVWPYSTIPQERCGPRQQVISIPASDFSRAKVIADLLVESILTNPYIWTCKIAGLREAEPDERPTAVRGDCDAVFKTDRQEIERADRDGYARGTSNAETNAMRVHDRLTLEIERLTFMVQALIDKSGVTEESLTNSWKAHRLLSIEMSEMP